jgi:acyl carrier protein
MDKAMVFEKIRAITADVADIAPEQITPESALMDDLDLSSMEIMTMLAEVEDTFELRIPERELRGFITMNDLVEYVVANAANAN